MEFGDKEWFEKLEKNIEFPSMQAFYITVDKTVFSKEVKTKSIDISKIPYGKLATYSDDMSLANIVHCISKYDYYEECKRLKEIWGV